ncbi:MAG: helix-turn-helix transcriptional regulator [Rhodospirillales bacterium]
MGNRLKEIRLERGLSQEQLAELVHTDKSNISRLERGTRGLSGKWLRVISEKLGTTPDELLGLGGETAMPPSNASFAPGMAEKIPAGASMSRDVPILGTTVGGSDGDFALNGQVADYVRRPPALERVAGAFALYVQGDSMSRWREPGGLIFVHPTRPPKPGDHVVVELHPDEEDGDKPCFVKLLVRSTPTKLILGQYNPERFDIEFEKARVSHVYRVMEWEELLGL